MSRFLLIAIALLFFNGCGNKTVAINEHKKIEYTFKPNASLKLRSETYNALKKNKEVKKYFEENVAYFETNLNEVLNRIIDNSSSTSQNSNEYRGQSKQNSNNLFFDRFDALSINN